MAKRKLDRMLVFNVLKFFTILYISADKLLRDFVSEGGPDTMKLGRTLSKKFKESISKANVRWYFWCFITQFIFCSLSMVIWQYIAQLRLIRMWM